MAFASLIHRSIQIPRRFELGISSARPAFSSSVRFPPYPARHVFFHGETCYRSIRSPRMQCFKETSEDLKLSEVVQIIGHQSCDEDNDMRNVASETSSGQLNQMSKRHSSLRNVLLCVLAAVTFGLALGVKDGPGKASEYFAGYLLEQSLSVDNLFVFVLIFQYFKVPAEYQGRVLSYGIAGAIIFRATIILIGVATIERFEVVNLLLALILLFSSYKLLSAEDEDTDLADNFIVRICQRFIPVTSHYDGDRFLTVEEGVWKATPLLLTVVVLELCDIAFAVDSIPAVLGVTRDPLIVFSSNIFAISGLRSIYALISGSMSEMEYLQPAIGIVLGFIGTKMIFDFFGYHISTEVSLGFVATSITTAIVLSLVKKSNVGK